MVFQCTPRRGIRRRFSRARARWGRYGSAVGLFMRMNAFRGVSHVDVQAVVAEFWSSHGRRVERVPPDAEVDAFDVYEQRDGWTVMWWTRGWEWKLRRAAQLYVSEALGCAGILVFVYDGDEWGYELFDRGAAVG